MPAKTTETDPKITSLRLPLELWKRAQALAEQDLRSVHNEMLFLLEQAINAEEAKRVKKS